MEAELLAGSQAAGTLKIPAGNYFFNNGAFAASDGAFAASLLFWFNAMHFRHW
jgi:hypothetical protein